MKEAYLLENLLNTVRGKLPAGMRLASFLSDILCIGKEAVYRRLRGEVPFSFFEVSLIAEKTGISIDSILGNSNPHIIPFYYSETSFDSVFQEDSHLFEEYLHAVRALTEEDSSEMGIATNMIPASFIVRQFPNLFRLRVFKWQYQQLGSRNLSPFSSLKVNDKVLQLGLDYANIVENFDHTYLVLDSLIFNYLINDIAYFFSINLIDEADVAQMKGELFGLVNEMDRAARQGIFRTGKRLDIYISNTNFDSTYSYGGSAKTRVSGLSVFTVDVINSSDEKIFVMIKKWMESLKRTSVLISVTGEIPRKQFFKKQRQLIENLL